MQSILQAVLGELDHALDTRQRARQLLKNPSFKADCFKSLAAMMIGEITRISIQEKYQSRDGVDVGMAADHCINLEFQIEGPNLSCRANTFEDLEAIILDHLPQEHEYEIGQQCIRFTVGEELIFEVRIIDLNTSCCGDECSPDCSEPDGKAEPPDLEV